MNLVIKVKQTEPGRFMIGREDGRSFDVRKIFDDPIRKKGIYWIIESMDSFAITHEKTFRAVKANISHGWTRGVTKETGIQDTPGWWLIAYGHEVQVPNPKRSDVKRDRQAWLVDNTAGSYYASGYSEHETLNRYYFLHENDAVCFKMRWG